MKGVAMNQEKHIQKMNENLSKLNSRGLIDLNDEKMVSYEAYRKLTIYPNIFLQPYREKIIDMIKLKGEIISIPNAYSSKWAIIFNLIGPIIDTKLEREFAQYVFNVDGEFDFQHRLTPISKNTFTHRFDFTLTEPSGKVHLFETKYFDSELYQPSQLSVKMKNDIKLMNGYLNDKPTKRNYQRFDYRVTNRFMNKLVFMHNTENPKSTISFLNHHWIIKCLFESLFTCDGMNIELREETLPLTIIIAKNDLKLELAIQKVNEHIKKSYQVKTKVMYFENIIEKAIVFAAKINNQMLLNHYQVMNLIYANNSGNSHE
jgi:hypothetical protein